MVFKEADEQAYRLCMTLRRLSRCCQRRQVEAVACAELTATECQALSWLAENPKGKLEALSAYLDVTRGRLTRVLDGLQKKGLVLRSPGSEDRRSVSLTLTARGRNRQERANHSQLRGATRVLAAFTPDERGSLLKQLDQLLVILEEQGKGEEK